MDKRNRDFRWGFHCNYLKSLGIKCGPRTILVKAIKGGTVKEVGDGQYRLLKRRKPKVHYRLVPIAAKAKKRKKRAA